MFYGKGYKRVHMVFSFVVAFSEDANGVFIDDPITFIYTKCSEPVCKLIKDCDDNDLSSEEVLKVTENLAGLKALRKDTFWSTLQNWNFCVKLVSAGSRGRGLEENWKRIYFECIPI